MKTQFIEMNGISYNNVGNAVLFGSVSELVI